MIKSETYINEEHVVVILYNILCSLNFIHSAGVIHRDIKPSNILIDLESQIKICDFGISRLIPKTDNLIEAEKTLKKAKKHNYIYSESEKERQSFKDSISDTLIESRPEREKIKRQMSPCCQTRWYRAPEIIMMEKQYDQSIDIWGVGLVLAELMAKADSFKKKSSAQNDHQ